MQYKYKQLILQVIFNIFLILFVFLLQSLCRDLEKEGTKAWLDMMLEKLSSTHASEGGEENLSGRDKAMKAQEKKKLESMIERHNSLMAPTMEAQSTWLIYP